MIHIFVYLIVPIFTWGRGIALLEKETSSVLFVLALLGSAAGGGGLKGGRGGEGGFLSAGREGERRRCGSSLS